MICIQFNAKVEIFCFDYDRMFGGIFHKYLGLQGIDWIVKRKSRHLLVIARSPMFSMDVPTPY